MSTIVKTNTAKGISLQKVNDSGDISSPSISYFAQQLNQLSIMTESYDLVVGTQAEVDLGTANYTLADLYVPATFSTYIDLNNNRILFTENTFVLTASLNFTAKNLTVHCKSNLSIINSNTFTITFSHVDGGHNVILNLFNFPTNGLIFGSGNNIGYFIPSGTTTKNSIQETDNKFSLFIYNKEIISNYKFSGSYHTDFTNITGTTASYNLTNIDYVILCNTTVDLTLNLPAAANVVGRQYLIKNLSTRIISIVPNGVETIEGVAGTKVLGSQYDTLTIQSTGIEWITVTAAGGGSSFASENLTYQQILSTSFFGDLYEDLFQTPGSVTLSGTPLPVFNGSSTGYNGQLGSIITTPNMMDAGNPTTFYNFMFHIDADASSLITAEYTINGTNWFACTVDTVVVTTGFITNLQLRFTFGGTGKLYSFGTFWNDINATTTSNVVFKEYLTVGAGGYAISAPITLPNGRSYPLDNKSLDVYLNRVKLIVGVDYTELNSRQITTLKTIFENDVLEFNLIQGYIDTSYNNSQRLTAIEGGKGVANGYGSLDGTGKQTLSEVVRISNDRFNGVTLQRPSITQVRLDVTDGINVMGWDSGSITNMVADITVTGAGGLQSGQTETSSTWYRIILMADISTPTAPVFNLMLSSGTATPVLPGTYTQWRYIGDVYNDGSSNFRDFTQIGKSVSFVEIAAITGGSASTPTNVSVPTILPLNAIRWSGKINKTVAAGTVYTYTNTSGHGKIGASQFNVGTTDFMQEVDIGTAQNICYSVDTNGVSIWVSKYTLSL